MNKCKYGLATADLRFISSKKCCRNFSLEVFEYVTLHLCLAVEIGKYVSLCSIFICVIFLNYDFSNSAASCKTEELIFCFTVEPHLQQLGISHLLSVAVNTNRLTKTESALLFVRMDSCLSWSNLLLYVITELHLLWLCF